MHNVIDGIHVAAAIAWLVLLGVAVALVVGFWQARPRRRRRPYVGMYLTHNGAHYQIVAHDRTTLVVGRPITEPASGDVFTIEPTQPPHTDGPPRVLHDQRKPPA